MSDEAFIFIAFVAAFCGILGVVELIREHILGINDDED